MKNATPILQFSYKHPLESEESYQYVDVEVLKFWKEFNYPIPEGFGIVRPALGNVRAALIKGDNLEVYNIPQHIEDGAFGFLKRHFVHLFKTCSPVPYEAVKIQPDTASGFPYGNKKKGDVIWSYDDFLRWYVARGNLNRPPPVFKVTPKIEYLPEEKLNEHKIRLFRNPPVDFLILEKMYFQQQEEKINTCDRRTWSALGFVKEFGGWDNFIRILDRHRFKYRWDIEKFDKFVGPRLSSIPTRLRAYFYKDWATEVDPVDWEFLSESAEYAFEILFNGQLYQTGNCQKSGRLRTASDNTIIHIFMLFVHYFLWCEEQHIEPNYEECIEEWINYIYSDDIQGSTDNKELVALERLQRTFALVGMGIQDYCCSENLDDIHFLGASNRAFTHCGREVYIPHYNEERMFYAMVHVGGTMNMQTRAERILGLYHNVCFDEKAHIVGELINYLNGKGLWPASVPKMSLFEVQCAYLGLEGKGSFFPSSDCVTVGSVSPPQSPNLTS